MKFLALLKKQNFETALPIVKDCLEVLHSLYSEVLEEEEVECEEYTLTFHIGCGSDNIEWEVYLTEKEETSS